MKPALLERIKFLAIFGSNMDEFLWCASQHPQMVEAHIMEVSPDGMTPPDARQRS
jgi:polyphosphate kinase